MPDGIVLVGMPASGKSTVGRIVAERLNRRFVDTDELVERRLGMPVSAYLVEAGEAAFRAAEAAAVREACAVRGAVVAAGGGAVVDPLNRWRLWRHGTVAWLDAAPERLVARLEADPVDRPTFRPYRADAIATILAARAPAYRAADLRLDAHGTPDAIATTLVTALEAQDPATASRRLFDAEVARHHPLGGPTARVVMGVSIGPQPMGDAVAVVDRRLLRAAPSAVNAVPTRACLPVAGGERAKRLGRLGRLIDWLAEQNVERGTHLVAIGGGTIGDLAGTAAALFARGLPLVQVPTTWLAQADSAIGGKVAVDLASAKNAAGAFWPPVAVVSDVAALRSLPRRVRRDGMAESVKAALIGDPDLWRLLEDSGRAALHTDEAARYAIIERSARLKLAVCQRDPFEEGERRTLNLGHTIGHALEVEAGFRLPHGAAVALGMRGAAAIADGRGAHPQVRRRLDDLLGGLGFDLARSFDPGRVRSALLGDKKRRGGRQRWILPMEVGRTMEVDDVTDAELERALRAIAA